MKSLSQVTVTIPVNGTSSNEVDIGGRTVYGVMFGGPFTGTTMSFAMSTISGGTFVPVYGDDGSAISVTVTGTRFVALNNKHIALRATNYLKLVSGTTEAAARTLIMQCLDE